MTHLCHAKGCTKKVPPRMFMCREHWYMLPRHMRDAVWAAYVPGQENRKDPTKKYIEIAHAAIEHIAEMEGK
jgi:hypothetical protein